VGRSNDLLCAVMRYNYAHHMHTCNEQFLHCNYVCHSFKFSLNLFCVIYIHILFSVLLVSVAGL